MVELFDYISSQGILNVNVLLTIRQIFQRMVFNLGYVTEKDMRQVHSIIADKLLRPDGVLPHINLVIRVCLFPVVTDESIIHLYLRSYAKNCDDHEFLSSLLLFLKSEAPKTMPPSSLDTFKRDAYTFMSTYNSNYTTDKDKHPRELKPES